MYNSEQPLSEEEHKAIRREISIMKLIRGKRRIRNKERNIQETQSREIIRLSYKKA